MLYYLDSVIVIYAVEGNQVDQQRALQKLQQIETAGNRFAISDLTRGMPGAGVRPGRRPKIVRARALLSRIKPADAAAHSGHF